MNHTQHKWIPLLLSTHFLWAEESYVIGSIFAELGNNLFQVATTCSLAWDNNAIPLFPEMVSNRLDNPFNPQNILLNYSHLFFRCNTSQPSQPLSFQWDEPSFTYHSIPYQPNMRIWGYFQSEKYFVHYRSRLLELFSPNSDDLYYIQTKYQWILEHPNTVRVQIREQYEDPSGQIYVQYGKDYLKQASTYFPNDSLYIISSNNMAFAQENIPEEMTHVIFIDNEPHYINFFLMSLCKHNIITNSTFGWWCAWLNQNPNKIIITPALWFMPSCPLPRTPAKSHKNLNWSIMLAA